MKKLLITALALAAMLAGLYAFVTKRPTTPAPTTTTATKLRVVTTNSILEDMVHNVGKDRIDLYSIVSRGTDPHEYEPRPNDIKAATEADVVFHNGLNLETGGNGWFKKLMTTANKQDGRDVFAASAGVKAKHLSTNQNEVDPHAWLDLNNGAQYVRSITRALRQKDSQNAAYYQKNADAYIAKLEALHQRAQAQFADIPEAARLLVTSEGAFKYFGAAYHVTPAYIWEINTEAQGTPEQMQAVLARIQAAKPKAVFVESSVSPKSMNKVAKETSLPIHAKLFTDSLAEAGTTGDTYYGMMQWNLDQIHAGLAG